jgi:RimJ/RimL family protein N-acetyltransferase
MKHFDIVLPKRVPDTPSERLQDHYKEGLILVNGNSRKPRKTQVLTFARYFKREFDYDFVQFSETEKGLDFEAWLFFQHHIHVMEWEKPVGACCFRKRQHEDGLKEHWALSWIWIHPYYRGKGILKEYFPFFRKRYGEFHPEPPLSRTMISFIEKHYPDAKGQYSPDYRRSVQKPS